MKNSSKALRSYSLIAKFGSLCIIALTCCVVVFPSLASASSGSSSGMVLRIRLGDGSMEKVLIPEGAEETMSLDDILKPLSVEKDAVVKVGGRSDNAIVESSSTVASLSLKHGSILTIQSSQTPQKPSESRFSQLKVDPHTWDPFPDLAKDYEHALLKSKTKRASTKSMSYGAIASLQSSLHVVEPQVEGPLKRVYMCRVSAERFQVNGFQKSKTKKGEAQKPTVNARVGLLLGTIQRERVHKTPRKARTSLSSQTSDSDFCQVAKVQAVWEPSGQKAGKSYDAKLAQSMIGGVGESDQGALDPRVLAVAAHLGLVPIGWIFSYSEARHEDEDSLPVYGLDVQTGAKLQIANMRKRGVVDGKPFTSLAMDANTGATEAFQLSDVSVQMVHEDILQVKENIREVPTKHNILIKGKESKTLDSVLCLVNTAMLSHEGAYAGKSATSFVKKNGSLTNKAKKSILATMNDDPKLLEMLCDFNVLLALDKSLSAEDTENLCSSVKKWARGQKQGTKVDSNLKLRLRSVLET